MKSLIRNTVFYTIAIFILPYIVDGVSVQGGIATAFVGGLTLTILFAFLKPLLSIITFPLNALTLGLTSLLVNVFLLYLLTVFIPSIKIQAFVFSGRNFAGFVIPHMSVNVFFTFALCALIVYAVTAILAWLTR